jgi:hypothetical protein
VTGDGEGLVGHAGAVLLRKLADQAGLTAALGPTLTRAGKFPLVDRGIALVSMAVAIVLGATSMNDIVLFTCGWAITGADEQAIRLLPAAAWQAALGQDGAVQEDKHVAEITHLLSRAAGWPAGLRWIARRTKPSRRQMKNLTAFQRATGWRYSIIVTNIPAAGGIGGVPGSHHAQFIDVLHREHAVVEDQVRTNKAMGLRNLPSRTADGC